MSGGPTPRPRVSVAIPAFNAESWIGDAIESVLRQTFSDFELVVVDDASQDGTAEVASAVTDDRIRLVRNPANLGHSGNWNRAVSLCRAPFVKFLCADDVLRPDCLEKMVGLAEAEPSVGMVFSRRTIECDPSDRIALEWRDAHGSEHLEFGGLERVNDGRRLFARCREDEFHHNWVGEPTNVLMRRDLYERVGGFPRFIKQSSDLGLWLRAMFHAGVGFIDAPLVTYRIVSSSMTVSSRDDGSRWLDHLWLLESLVDDSAIVAAFPELPRMTRRERLHMVGFFVKDPDVRRHAPARLRDAWEYCAYKLRARRVAQPSDPADGLAEVEGALSR
jgi:glycosyltransferase involved in cell wall biosynthesis